MAQFQVIWGPAKGEALTLPVSLVSQSNGKVFQANPTLAAGDVKISKDGGAFANVATLGSVAPASGKVVVQGLSADEMNADEVVLVFSDAAGDEWEDLTVAIITAGVTRTSTPANKIGVDSSGRVDVGSWLGNAVTVDAGNRPDVNVAAISGDSTAADNLESYTDGTSNIPVDAVAISGSTTAADNLESYTTGGDRLPVHVEEYTSSFDFSSTMKTSIQTAVSTVLNTAITASPTAGSVYERIKAIDELVEADGDGDLAAILDYIETDGVKIDLEQSLSESPTALTVGSALYGPYASVHHKIERDGTSLIVYKSNGTTAYVTRTLDSATNTTEISP